MFSSCDLTADKKAHVSFKPRQALSELNPRAQVTTQFHSSTKARNWAQTKDDFKSAFMTGMAPELLPAAQAPPVADNPPIQPTSASGEKKTSVILQACQLLKINTTLTSSFPGLNLFANHEICLV